MENPIKQIVKFNKDANLLEQGYDSKREIAYPIEEMLEGFNSDVYHDLIHDLGEFEFEPTPKGVSRAIAAMVTAYEYDISEVEIFDKHIDAIVFCVGSLAKLGLSPQQIQLGINTVMRYNLQKLNMPKDSEGKLMKPEGFVGPEEELQKILDKREK